MREMSRRDFVQTTGAGLLTMPSLRADQAPVAEPASHGEELCFTPATILAAAIRQKKVSPVEVINAVYERLYKINPKINAFCTLTEEQAHRMAKEAEAAVMRGDRLGALHGVPVSIKDVFLTRGVRTMFGSRIRENYVPEDDAPAVAKLLAAGAILIGKTTTCYTLSLESVFSGFTVQLLFGQSYSATFPVSGGIPPYNWRMSSVPPGFTFDTTSGTFTGTGVGGTFVSPNVSVSDSSNPQQGTYYAGFSLNVYAKLAFLTSSLPPITTNGTTWLGLNARGGGGPYTWTISSGSLPPGMNFKNIGGNSTITGSPTSSGTYNFTVKIVDGNSGSLQQTVSFPLTLVVKDPAQMHRNDSPRHQIRHLEFPDSRLRTRRSGVRVPGRAT
jgi:hypothetical protein